MTKAEFLKKWRRDWKFRSAMKVRGIRVIQDNVIFLRNDGIIDVAGVHVK